MDIHFSSFLHDKELPRLFKEVPDAKLEIRLKHEMDGQRKLESYLTDTFLKERNVVAIHTPEFHNYETLIESKRSYNIIKQICEVTHCYSMKEYVPLYVIVHSELTYRKLVLTDLVDDLCSNMQEVLDMYPTTQFCIEPNPYIGSTPREILGITNLLDKFENENVGVCFNLFNYVHARVASKSVFDDGTSISGEMSGVFWSIADYCKCVVIDTVVANNYPISDNAYEIYSKCLSKSINALKSESVTCPIILHGNIEDQLKLYRKLKDA